MSDFIIVHPLSRVPIIKFEPAAECRPGQIFFIPVNREWTISQTKEQDQELILSLKSRVDELEHKLKAIDEIMNPQDYEEDYE